MAAGTAALVGGATGLFGGATPNAGFIGASAGPRRDAARNQDGLHPVAAAHGVPRLVARASRKFWRPQQSRRLPLLDGQNKVEVQVSLMDTLINQRRPR